MRIDSSNLRMHSFFLPWTAGPRFLRKGSTLQVQETGLVVQGFLRKLRMPLFDILFQPVLSEWSTVTVPYSRITNLRYRWYPIARVILTLISLAPLLMLLPTLPSPDMLEATAFVGFGSAVLALYVNVWMLAPRFHLHYRGIDGNPSRLSLRIRNKGLRRLFAELVAGNRRELSTLGRSRKKLDASRRIRRSGADAFDDEDTERIERATPRRWAAPRFFGLLALYLVGTMLMPPLWLALRAWFNPNAVGRDPWLHVSGVFSPGPGQTADVFAVLASFLGTFTPVVTLGLLCMQRSRVAGWVALVSLVGHSAYDLAWPSFAFHPPDQIDLRWTSLVAALFHAALALLVLLVGSNDSVAAATPAIADDNAATAGSSTVSRLSILLAAMTMLSFVAPNVSAQQTSAIIEVVELSANASLDPQRKTHFKAVPFKMSAGKSYVIDLMKLDPKSTLDPFLILKDPAGKQVAFDDDSGGGLNARIVYSAHEDGVHSIIATTIGPGQFGKMMLTAREGQPLGPMPGNVPLIGKGIPPGNPGFAPPGNPPNLGAAGMWALIVVGLIYIVIALAILGAFGAILGVQAKRRGYSFWVWLLAGIFAINPLLPLVLLGLLPNRRRQQLRIQERQRLVNEIEETASRSTSVATALGDSAVPLQPKASATQEAIRAQSIGDDETRL